MLTSLCRRCIITDGSSRESDMEWLLWGGLLSVSKGFSTLVLWFCCSGSCIARRFRLRRKKNRPPAMAAIAARPTTTPATMPPVLGPLDALCVSADAGAALVWPGAVTTTVAALVIVDGVLSLVVSGCAAAAAGAVGLLLAAGPELVVVDADDGETADDGKTAAVGDGLESELELGSCALPTLLFSPVSDTVQVLSPPPRCALALAKKQYRDCTYICHLGSPGSLCCIVSLRSCCLSLAANHHTNNLTRLQAP